MSRILTFKTCVPMRSTAKAYALHYPTAFLPHVKGTGWVNFSRRWKRPDGETAAVDKVCLSDLGIFKNDIVPPHIIILQDSATSPLSLELVLWVKYDHNKENYTQEAHLVKALQEFIEKSKHSVSVCDIILLQQANKLIDYRR